MDAKSGLADDERAEEHQAKQQHHHEWKKKKKKKKKQKEEWYDDDDDDDDTYHPSEDHGDQNSQDPPYKAQQEGTARGWQGRWLISKLVTGKAHKCIYVNMFIVDYKSYPWNVFYTLELCVTHTIYEP